MSSLHTLHHFSRIWFASCFSVSICTQAVSCSNAISFHQDLFCCEGFEHYTCIRLHCSRPECQGCMQGSQLLLPVHAGDLRRAKAACERLVLIAGEEFPAERRDLAVILLHCGFLSQVVTTLHGPNPKIASISHCMLPSAI